MVLYSTLTLVPLIGELGPAADFLGGVFVILAVLPWVKVLVFTLEAPEDNLVQDDFKLATAADIVADPSAPGAFVNGIMENKEWLFVDGRFVEADIDSAKRQIRQASRKDIEQVALTLFENFIRKL